MFYRSDDERGITAVGSCGIHAYDRKTPPRSLSSANLRTVYSCSEITSLASRGVLPIRFLQDRLMPLPITFNELLEAGVLAGRPQTITQVNSEEAITWLSQRINGSR